MQVLYGKIILFLGHSGDLLNILGMVGIALLTIFIPVAVAIFNDKKDFEILDRNVLLNYVVKAHRFLKKSTADVTPFRQTSNR